MTVGKPYSSKLLPSSVLAATLLTCLTHQGVVSAQGPQATAAYLEQLTASIDGTADTTHRDWLGIFDGLEAPSSHARSLIGVEREVTWQREGLDLSCVPTGGELEADVTVQAVDGSIDLTDVESGFSVRLWLSRDQTAGRPEVSDGRLLVRGAVAGGDLIRRARTDGFEDLLYFAQDPGISSLEYLLSLPEGASARLVDNTVELLDARGVAHLHVAPPYLLDATGERRDARLALQHKGRDYAIKVSWSPRGLTFPILVDPVFKTLASMATPRATHISANLPSGDVLVAGGVSEWWNPTTLSSAEVYKVSSNSWSATSPMNVPRSFHMAASLKDGRVLVAGGFDAQGNVVSSAEVYDPATGKWKLVAPMPSARAAGAVMRMPDGRIMLAGGLDANESSTQSVVAYHSGTNTWALLPKMNRPRVLHTLTRFTTADDKVEYHVIGGIRLIGGSNTNTPYKDSEWLNEAFGKWVLGGSMSTVRFGHNASMHPAGKVVLVAGGANSYIPADAALTSELYDPALRSFGSVANLGGPSQAWMAYATDAEPDSGTVYVAGGEVWLASGPFPLETTREYKWSTNSWAPGTPMTLHRSRHSQSRREKYDMLIGGHTNAAWTLPSTSSSISTF